MEKIGLYTVILAATLLITTPVEADLFVGHGIDLSQYSSVSGGYTTFGAQTNISDTIAASSYITVGAGVVSQDLKANAITMGASATANDVYASTLVAGAGSKHHSANAELDDIHGAMLQLNDAQKTLFAMKNDYELLATTSGGVFEPGVYRSTALTSAAGSTITLDGKGQESPFWVFNLDTYLVTGANTTIEIVNSGDGASVIWNAGGYISMGANTSFLGSAFTGAYVSGGAGAGVSCGNLFAKSYITLGASVDFTSTNCIGTDSWNQSSQTLAASAITLEGLEFTQFAMAAPEPPLAVPVSYINIAIIGVFLLLCSGKLARRKNNKSEISLENKG
jgi:hypothetical protein